MPSFERKMELRKVASSTRKGNGCSLLFLAVHCQRFLSLARDQAISDRVPGQHDLRHHHDVVAHAVKSELWLRTSAYPILPNKEFGDWLAEMLHRSPLLAVQRNIPGNFHQTPRMIFTPFAALLQIKSN